MLGLGSDVIQMYVPFNTDNFGSLGYRSEYKVHSREAVREWPKFKCEWGYDCIVIFSKGW